ncbi:MAG: hypothetical protein HGA36_00015 [Candidatus Moranbacteria bacterium]|nr:hypothetical protein [Candidatus Moranbacteria bacterium]
MKKLFIISAILLVVVLIFLGIYNFAFKKDAPTTQQIIAPVVDTSKALSGVKTEKITAISDGGVLGAIMDKKTEEIKYYETSTGLVWKMDAEGKGKQRITDVKVLGLKKVLWSIDASKVLTVTQKEGQNSFYMYDYRTQKGTLLKNGLDTAVWDNLGTKIFYKYFDNASQKRTMDIANPDGSEWQKIADITARNIVIAPVPLTSLVSYWNAPNASEETQLQIVGATGGDAKTILSGKYGADYLWSPDGNKALVSSLSSNKNMTLGIVSMDGTYQDLNIPTFVSKCAWSQDGKTVYYALAGGIPTGANMPNDYQENKFNTEDTFWKMDIATGKKDRIIETSEINGKYDSSELFLSVTEDALYFVNKIDKKLYRLEF